jgi:transglutaminase-like putative cysteine protease
VIVNFTLIHKSGPGNYYFKFARLNNRVPNSTTTRYTPPYQESRLLFNRVIGNNPNALAMGIDDRFNNTYDLFNATLASEGIIKLNQKYIITLNAIKFQVIQESEIGTYDTSNYMFDLYCNKSEIYYERNDPSLIALSNSIVSPSDNPVEKAQKIFTWVSDNIEYNGNLPLQERGALWAYQNLEGDCSEYTSLMVTLLRIQNIPARKITGFVISNNYNLEPTVGDKWNFITSDSTDKILGHAWVEYYIPSIGWIACDPTWNTATNYFNTIDYLRFNSNVGSNFFIPPSGTVSEFLNPIFSYSMGADYDFEFKIKISVLESDFAPINLLSLIINISIIIAIPSVAILLILVIKSRRKKNFYE